MSETTAKAGRQALEKPRVDFGELRKAGLGGLGLRFAFGAGISLAAGLIGIVFGPKIGGLFLAFPAILPASLTLIARKQGRQEAEIDSLGATVGAVAMVLFAVLAAAGINSVGPLAGLATALGGWLLLAAVLYLAVTGIARRRVARRRKPAA